MNSIFEPKSSAEILTRIEKLHPDMQPLWGTMKPAQMMAHCSAFLEMVAGRLQPPRTEIGLRIGEQYRHMASSDVPFRHGAESDVHLRITTEKEFLPEQERLKALVAEISAAGEGGTTNSPHPFFGELSAAEWGLSSYKHLDHHLRQFGV